MRGDDPIQLLRIIGILLSHLQITIHVLSSGDLFLAMCIAVWFGRD